MNSAVDDGGQWRVDRRLLALGGALLALVVVAVWPVGIVPSYVHDDGTIHFAGGAALTLLLAASIPREDHAIAAAVAAAGVLWEPAEWWLYRCYQWIGTCEYASLQERMLGQDTLADMTLVALGALVALIVIGRYN